MSDTRNSCETATQDTKEMLTIRFDPPGDKLATLWALVRIAVALMRGRTAYWTIVHRPKPAEQKP